MPVLEPTSPDDLVGLIVSIMSTGWVETSCNTDMSLKLADSTSYCVVIYIA